jgi:hypothetical protein
VQQFLVRIGETRLELNTIPYLVLLHLLKHPTFRPHLCLSENSGYLKLHVLALPLVLVSNILKKENLTNDSIDKIRIRELPLNSWSPRSIARPRALHYARPRGGSTQAQRVCIPHKIPDRSPRGFPRNVLGLGATAAFPDVQIIRHWLWIG